MLIDKIDRLSPTILTKSGVEYLQENMDSDTTLLGVYFEEGMAEKFIEGQKDEIKKSAIIEATNIYNYLETNGLPSGDLSIKHVPFHKMWIEWKGVHGAHVVAMTKDQYIKTTDKLIELNLPKMDDPRVKNIIELIANTDRELLFISISCYIKTGSSFDIIGNSSFFMDINTGEVNYVSKDDVIVSAIGILICSQIEGSTPYQWIRNYETVVASTIKFMNCKNVLIKTNNPPIKLQKNRQRKNKKPLYSYKTIEIRPIRVLKAMSDQKSDIGYSLHICRGHFKDYTKGKGLFGRIHGSFWWEEQVRGDIKYGISEHDYKINTEASV